MHIKSLLVHQRLGHTLRPMGNKILLSKPGGIPRINEDPVAAQTNASEIGTAATTTAPTMRLATISHLPTDLHRFLTTALLLGLHTIPTPPLLNTITTVVRDTKLYHRRRLLVPAIRRHLLATTVIGPFDRNHHNSTTSTIAIIVGIPREEDLIDIAPIGVIGVAMIDVEVSLPTPRLPPILRPVGTVLPAGANATVITTDQTKTIGSVVESIVMMMATTVAVQIGDAAIKAMIANTVTVMTIANTNGSVR